MKLESRYVIAGIISHAFCPAGLVTLNVVNYLRDCQAIKLAVIQKCHYFISY